MLQFPNPASFGDLLILFGIFSIWLPVLMKYLRSILLTISFLSKELANHLLPRTKRSFDITCLLCLGFNGSIWLLGRRPCIKKTHFRPTWHWPSFRSICIGFITTSQVLAVVDHILFQAWRVALSYDISKWSTSSTTTLFEILWDWHAGAEELVRAFFLVAAFFQFVFWLCRCRGQKDRSEMVSIHSWLPVSFTTVAFAFKQLQYCSLSFQSTIRVFPSSSDAGYSMVASIRRAEDIASALLWHFFSLNFIFCIIVKYSVHRTPRGMRPFTASALYEAPGPDNDDLAELPVPGAFPTVAHELGSGIGSSPIEKDCTCEHEEGSRTNEDDVTSGETRGRSSSQEIESGQHALAEKMEDSVDEVKESPGYFDYDADDEPNRRPSRRGKRLSEARKRAKIVQEGEGRYQSQHANIIDTPANLIVAVQDNASNEARNIQAVINYSPFREITYAPTRPLYAGTRPFDSPQVSPRTVASHHPVQAHPVSNTRAQIHHAQNETHNEGFHFQRVDQHGRRNAWDWTNIPMRPTPTPPSSRGSTDSRSEPSSSSTDSTSEDRPDSSGSWSSSDSSTSSRFSITSTGTYYRPRDRSESPDPPPPSSYGNTRERSRSPDYGSHEITTLQRCISREREAQAPIDQYRNYQWPANLALNEQPSRPRWRPYARLRSRPQPHGRFESPPSSDRSPTSPSPSRSRAESSTSSRGCRRIFDRDYTHTPQRENRLRVEREHYQPPQPRRRDYGPDNTETMSQELIRLRMRLEEMEQGGARGI